MDDDGVGAAVGDASEVLVRRAISECPVRAELLQASLALGAGAIGIDHAADREDVAGIELCHGRPRPADAADDLMSRNARINRRHNFLPLITHLMEIGMTDPAEEDFDHDVVLGWIASLDGRSGRMNYAPRYCSLLTCSIQSTALPSSCS
jgi:hypothetical protein